MELGSDLTRLEHLSPIAGEAFTVAERAKFGRTLAEAATATFALAEERKFLTSAVRSVYIGKSSKGLTLLTRSGQEFTWTTNEWEQLGNLLSQSAAADGKSLLHVFVEADVLRDPTFPMGSYPSNVVFTYVDPNGRLCQTHLAYFGNKLEPLVEWGNSSSLYMNIRDEKALLRFADLRGQAFRKSDVRVLALFDPPSEHDTVSALENTLSRSGVTHSIVASPDMQLEMRRAHRRQLIVIGHTEGPWFVVRRADNREVWRYSIADLRKLANEHKTTLILMGCQTGLGGFLQQVNSLAVASQLEKALGAATFEEFFTSIGTARAPFVLSTEQIAGVEYLVARRIVNREAPSAAPWKAFIAGDTLYDITVANVGEPPLWRQLPASFARWLWTLLVEVPLTLLKVGFTLFIIVGLLGLAWQILTSLKKLVTGG